MNKAPAEKDFGKSEPQIPSAYKHRPPPELRPLHEAGGGLNVEPLEITDANHRAAFVPVKEKEYDFGKRRK